MLPSHPSPAKSAWFLLPFGRLQHLHSWPRGGLVGSVHGLYWHLRRLLLATRRHHSTFLVVNVGQSLSGGYHMRVTRNKRRQWWISRQGWCYALAEVRRLCQWFWRLNERWAGNRNIYVCLEGLSWSGDIICAAIQLGNKLLSII